MMNTQAIHAVHLASQEDVSAIEIRHGMEPRGADRPAADQHDAVARWVVFQHLAVSPEIADIYYLPTNAPQREIRLLEVNRLAGRGVREIEAVDFNFDVRGLDYRLLVADISPDEHQRRQHEGLALPAGWTLDEASHWRRQ